MDETPPEQQQLIIEATPVVENSTAGSVLDDELVFVGTMKVVELRKEL